MALHILFGRGIKWCTCHVFLQQLSYREKVSKCSVSFTSKRQAANIKPTENANRTERNSTDLVCSSINCVNEKKAQINKLTMIANTN